MYEKNKQKMFTCFPPKTLLAYEKYVFSFLFTIYNFYIEKIVENI